MALTLKKFATACGVEISKDISGEFFYLEKLPDVEIKHKGGYKKKKEALRAWLVDKMGELPSQVLTKELGWEK